MVLIKVLEMMVNQSSFKTRYTFLIKMKKFKSIIYKRMDHKYSVSVCLSGCTKTKTQISLGSVRQSKNEFSQESHSPSGYSNIQSKNFNFLKCST